MAPLLPNRSSGKLIAVEGVDGCGKSTQISELAAWLRSLDLGVVAVQGNFSSRIRQTIRQGKRGKLLTPITLSLLQAAEFAHRLESTIVPALEAGSVVCADRYVFTAFARDAARGVNREWVRQLYTFAVRPDLCFWFRVPPDAALDRILHSRAKVGYYEAGMDLNISPDFATSYRMFQSRIDGEYEAMAHEERFCVIDGMHSIHEQQAKMRKTVAKRLGLALVGASDGELIEEYGRDCG